MELPAFLAKLERLDLEATPGPWKSFHLLDGICSILSQNYKNGPIVSSDTNYGVRGRSNADFIAQSRTLLPEALTHLQSQSKRIEELEAYKSQTLVQLDLQWAGLHQAELDMLNGEIQRLEALTHAQEERIKIAETRAMEFEMAAQNELKRVMGAEVWKSEGALKETVITLQYHVRRLEHEKKSLKNLTTHALYAAGKREHNYDCQKLKRLPNNLQHSAGCLFFNLESYWKIKEGCSLPHDPFDENRFRGCDCGADKFNANLDRLLEGRGE